MTADLDKLTASPHWEWRPGMRDLNGFVCLGATSVAVHRWQPDGEHLLWSDPRDGGLTWSPLRPNDLDGHDAAPTYPDLEHTGNHGHLLALVRKAWGSLCQFRIIIDYTGATVTITPPGRTFGEAFAAKTLGLALAAALLAAPPPKKAGEP